jgi:glycosyltransferase involved in cell wall biosynthesis
MLQEKTIAVIVPAYNEERLIETTLRSVPGYVDHIVVVDDGSSDTTAGRVQQLRDPRLLFVRHERNRGVGAALTTGYQVAFGAGADVAAVMAGDGQMDPDDLEALLEPLLLEKADYVKGNRLSHPDVLRQMPPLRWVGNHLLTWLTRWAVGISLSDSQCGYTALSCHAASRVPLELLWNGYGYPNDLIGWLSLAGVRIHEVQVKPVYGEEISGIGLRHALWVIPSVLTRVWLRRIKSLRQAPQTETEPQLLPLSQAGDNAVLFQ